VALNDLNNAFEGPKKGCDDGSSYLIFLNIEPLLENLLTMPVPTTDENDRIGKRVITVKE